MQDSQICNGFLPRSETTGSEQFHRRKGLSGVVIVRTSINGDQDPHAQIFYNDVKVPVETLSAQGEDSGLR